MPEAARVLGYSEGHIYRWKRGEEAPRESVLRLLSMEIERKRRAAFTEKNFTFIDLFAGIGGLRRAMEGAGGRCVFTSEWDKYAQQTYMANFLTTIFRPATYVRSMKATSRRTMFWSPDFHASPFRSPASQRRTPSAARF